LTIAQYAAIQTDIRTLEPPATDVVGQADFFGGLVRLAFHDAGTYTLATNTFGPDGCLNMSDPANGGLQPVIDNIEPVYQNWKSKLSRADFWVIAAYTAVLDAGGPNITFMYGRKDCTSYPNAGLLPNPEKDWSEVFNVFVTRMGLTVTDIVALLGAHTLGRAQPQNSGYEFFWTRSPNRFTNAFYHDLTSLAYERVLLNTSQHQWDTYPPPPSGDPLMMLNTDMSLVYGNVGQFGMGVCNDTVQAPCTENNVTFNLVMSYATDQQHWFDDFTVGFTKLTSLGCNVKPLSSAATALSPLSALLLAGLLAWSSLA